MHRFQRFDDTASRVKALQNIIPSKYHGGISFNMISGNESWDTGCLVGTKVLIRSYGNKTECSNN